MSRTLTTPKGTELPLMNLKGKPYLQVAFRLQWMVEENPSYTTQVELLEHTEEATLAKVSITLFDASTGRPVKAVSDVKRESKKDFHDHAEKAVTGAMGRCLAQLGYGTQFALQDLDEGERIVDSPINTTGSTEKSPISVGAGAAASTSVATAAPAQSRKTTFTKKQVNGASDGAQKEGEWQ